MNRNINRMVLSQLELHPSQPRAGMARDGPRGGGLVTNGAVLLTIVGAIAFYLFGYRTALCSTCGAEVEAVGDGGRGRGLRPCDDPEANGSPGGGVKVWLLSSVSRG